MSASTDSATCARRTLCKWNSLGLPYSISWTCVSQLILFLANSGFEKDPTTSKFEIYAKIKQLSLIGLYKVSGSVIILPVRGSGPSNLTLGKNPNPTNLMPKEIITNLIVRRQRRIQHQTDTKGRTEKGKTVLIIFRCGFEFFDHQVIVTAEQIKQLSTGNKKNRLNVSI